MWMGCPQDNTGNLRMFFDNFRKRLQHVFNAFIGGKQAECEQHLLAFHAKLIFVIVGIHKRCIRNTVMDKSNFFFRHSVDFFKKIYRLSAHDDQFVGQGSQRAHDFTIFRGRIFQNRMQRCHYRHAKLPEKLQQMAAGWAAENAVFMLHADNISLTDIEKLRSDTVVGQCILVYLEADLLRIGISFRGVIHGNRPAIYVGSFCCQSINQVRSEGCNAALARHIVADDGNRPDTLIILNNRWHANGLLKNYLYRYIFYDSSRIVQRFFFSNV